MASAQILTNGKALYAYSGSVWYGLNTSGNLVNATRWQKIATGGETTLSGNDDTGEALSYTPGFEQVYLNGVLLARDLDYTATDGTTITGLTALTAGYIVEVIAYNNINVGNTYTQAQIDNKVANTFTRWVETLSASATVLSGLDDNSNTLSYTPGLEQVYVNGILLLPSEYTATSGSSIVLSEAAVSGDVIQVYTLKNFRVPNTYTITQTDDQFLTKTSASGTYLSQSSASSTYQTKASNGLVLLNSTNFSAASSYSISSVFTSEYENYLITFNWTQNNSNQLYFRLRSGSTDESGANYKYSGFNTITNSTTVTGMNNDSNTVWRIGYATGSDVIGGACQVTLWAPQNSSRRTMYQSNYSWYNNTRFENGWISGGHTQVASYDGFTFFCDGATPSVTGQVQVYGLKE